MRKLPEEQIINGLTGGEGIAIGSVWVIDDSKQAVTPKKIRSFQVLTNIKRFAKAKELFLSELDELSKNLDSATREIFEAQKHIVSDVEIEGAVIQLIEKERFSVDYAIYNTFGRFIERLEESGSELFRQRIVDLENLRDRLIQLSCENEKQRKVPKGSILVVRDISPTDLVTFFDQGISALVMDKGGVTSHAAIIAQSLNIPCVVSTKTAVKASKSCEKIIVDGGEGTLVINPTPATQNFYKQKLKEYNRAQREILKVKEQSLTTDGFIFHLRANVEFVQELELVKKSHAEGIGLLRTEALLYGGIEKRHLDEQIKFYSTTLEQTSGPITIRLFDVGGDKLKMSFLDEDNPFLGWRGIRMLLDEREMLETQLQAILTVSGNHLGRIQILVPMVTDLEEIREVKTVLELIKNRLEQDAVGFDHSIRIGIMVEVPSVALLASHFAKEIDFFSIGTNDLTQYALAVDRGNERICSLYQHNHPAVWQLIYQTIYAANKENIPVAVCGELAGDLIGAATLVGMGVTDLSMSPHNIPRVKHLLSTYSQHDFKDLAQKVLNGATVAEVNKTFKALFSEKVEA